LSKRTSERTKRKEKKRKEKKKKQCKIFEKSNTVSQKQGNDDKDCRCSVVGCDCVAGDEIDSTVGVC
jgi:hypothetical protein